MPANMHSMRAHRRTAIAVGVLYIVGTVAGVASLALTASVRDATDPLVAVAAHESQLVTGALAILVMAVSLAMVAVLVFPILRRTDEVLATGYLVFRGALETTSYLVLAAGWLALVGLADASAQGAAAEGSATQLGTVLIKGESMDAVTAIVFCLGALLFYSALLRAKLVPSWLAVWGLVAVAPYLTAYVLAIYGAITATSTVQVLLVLPLAVQEMVLAIWLIARGFRAAPASTPAVPAASARQPVSAM